MAALPSPGTSARCELVVLPVKTPPMWITPAVAVGPSPPWSCSKHPRTPPSRRRDCHFANNPSPFLLKHLLKGEGGAAKSCKMSVSPTANAAEVPVAQVRIERQLPVLGGERGAKVGPATKQH